MTQTANNRKQAAEAGLSLYSTGKPCKHGHDSPRLTSNGNCYACHKANTQRWQQGIRDALQRNRP